jgi:hypothetical protein
VHELIGFGKWIFLSTVLSFVTNSAASLILGRFVSMTEVGVFSIAVTLASVVGQAYEQIGSKVLFPLYAKIKTEALPQLRARVIKIRLSTMALFVPPLWDPVGVRSAGGQSAARSPLPRWRMDPAAVCQLCHSLHRDEYRTLLLGARQFPIDDPELGNPTDFVHCQCLWRTVVVGSHGLIVGIAVHTLGMYVWMPRSNGDTGSGFRHSMRWVWVRRRRSFWPASGGKEPSGDSCFPPRAFTACLGPHRGRLDHSVLASFC